MANNPFSHRVLHCLAKEAQKFYGEQRVATYRASNSGYLSDATKHFVIFQALGEVTEQLKWPIHALDLVLGPLFLGQF